MEDKSPEIIKNDKGSPLPIQSRRRARVVHSKDKDKETEGQTHDVNAVTLLIPDTHLSSQTSNNWPELIWSISPLTPLEKEVTVDVENQYPWLGPSVS